MSEREQGVLEGRMGLPTEMIKEMLCSIESGRHVHSSMEVLGAGMQHVGAIPRLQSIFEKNRKI